MNYEHMRDVAQNRIDSLNNGTVFVVKDLFLGTDWDKLSSGEKKGFGRYFSNCVKEGQITSVCRDGENKAHSAKYKKV